MASESHFFFLIMFEQLFYEGRLVWKYNYKVLRSMIFIDFGDKICSTLPELYLKSFEKANVSFHYIFTLFCQNSITFTLKTPKPCDIDSNIY